MTTASALQFLAPQALVNRKPLSINRQAASGLAEVMGSNLGPKGSLKMLVGGAGQIKMTKDGNTLLGEMAIQHPTGMMIARAATAQDDISGDGTTSITIMINHVLKRAEESSTVHPRVLADGMVVAREKAIELIEKFKVSVNPDDPSDASLLALASTSLHTKVPAEIAQPLATYVLDAVKCIRKAPSVPEMGIDLHMVEIMHIKHKLAADTRFIPGLVLDHGARHPSMPKRLENCYILTCNVSLEYEKSELGSTFVYQTAEQKAKLARSERKIIDDRVAQIVALKNKLCTPENGKNFVVITQKGIDLPSLDALARANIIGLRRAKRRNMERLTLACGGNALFDLEGLSEADLGWAGLVYEHVMGDEKYTFIENVKNPASCTILIKGAHDHIINQIKEATRDGLRAVLNGIKDRAVLPGAGAFDIAMYRSLEEFAKTVDGKKKIGVQIFAEAIMQIPRTLCANAGLDVDEVTMRVMDAQNKANPSDPLVGFDIETGQVINPVSRGILDNVIVKRQMFTSVATIASQLLMVDEILKAGSFNKSGQLPVDEAD